MVVINKCVYLYQVTNIINTNNHYKKQTQMEKHELIDKITDRCTDSIYRDIIDTLHAYTLKYEIEEEDEIVFAVIGNMIDRYK